MRRLLLALPFALLPLAVAQAQPHEHEHDHEQGSLSAHEHGVAQLNAALDGKTLELELESPAMNLVGFEHAAKSDADKAKVAAARAELDKPLELFALPAAAGCKVASKELESPLFGDDHDHDDHAKGHDQEHSEIHAHYRFDCASPEQLKSLDLAELFKRFPATEKIQVQLIGPNGQQGAELSRSSTSLSF
ncbi:DUF2796 domain-containing protein [Metapseudomonas resinovorans]|uniref:DUF2796 domain-containing protein n=1 Tax=Metapseudomonas resinovorans TaxID=53412 RepID=UPI000411D199|nr:DUF2796 domain-containing protein [Pseudomonas resinovorans]MDE3738133.1 DUF2796 domain-containing protein [Pseudomonas resinovorans]